MYPKSSFSSQNYYQAVQDNASRDKNRAKKMNRMDGLPNGLFMNEIPDSEIHFNRPTSSIATLIAAANQASKSNSSGSNKTSSSGTGSGEPKDQ